MNDKREVGNYVRQAQAAGRVQIRFEICELCLKANNIKSVAELPIYPYAIWKLCEKCMQQMTSSRP